jgi:hypothetical protein
MVEMASAKFVCIVDDSKMVEGLGGSKLAMPVENTQFCHLYTLGRLQVRRLSVPGSVPEAACGQQMLCVCDGLVIAAAAGCQVPTHFPLLCLLLPPRCRPCPRWLAARPSCAWRVSARGGQAAQVCG